MSKSPSKSKGVGLFNHFPKNFLRPYGRAEDPPSSTTVFRWTNALNCELLVRPNIFFSELSETVSGNLPILQESPLLSKKTQAVVRELQQLEQTLSRFNLKDGFTELTDKSANAMLKVLIGETPITAFMEQAFLLGGALFNMSCSYLTAQTYLRDPSSLAERMAMAAGEDAAFKKSKSRKKFHDLLVAGHKRGHPSSKSDDSSSQQVLSELLVELSDDSEDDEPPRKKAKKSHRTKVCHELQFDDM